MFKKILAAVNEFVNSEVAAQYAITVAKSSRAKLFLVFVAEKNISRDILQQAESSLERLFIEARNSGVEVESAVESGKPVEKINEMVKEHNIDLVFAATRREDVTKRFFIKTISRQLIVKLPCSVAVVRAVKMGGIHLKHILVPLRGRITNLEERTHFIAKLAEGFDSRVTLFHLHKPITGFFHGEIHFKPVHRDKHIPHDVEEFFDHLNKYKIPVEKKIEYGGIVRSITAEAAFRKNDLIVMGASGKNLMSSLVKGNPVEAVLRETPCNLIIFRPRRGR